MKTSAVFVILLLGFLFQSFESGISPNPLPALENEQSLFDYLENGQEVLVHVSHKFNTIKKNFDKELDTEGTIEFVVDGKAMRFTTSMDLGGKTRRKICRLPPVKFNLKKSELDSASFVKSCDRLKIVFQCNTSRTMSESIRKEKFLYDLYGLVSPNGHRAIMVKVKMEGDKKYVDGFLLESDDDLEQRAGISVIKNKTIATQVLDRDEYLKMCLFQYMISNADWSARKGHNTDLYKRNADNSLLVVPYDFDYSGIINNNYAIPPENLPIGNVTQRYFMDKMVSPMELEKAISFYLSIEQDVYNLILDSPDLSDGSKKSLRKFIEGYYKIIKDKKKVKKLLK